MRSMSSTGRVVGTVSALLLAAAAVAHPPGDPRALPAGAVALGATVSREAGIEFVTIPASAGVAAGQTANRPWQGRAGVPSDGSVTNRGSVGYDYRIGRYEVTTAQWVEFMNVALDRPSNDRLPFVNFPDVWTATRTTPTNAGGMRWTFTEPAAMRPVGSISWRTAAMYCNWLHNDKRMDRSAFLTGAYDTSLFGTLGGDDPAVPRLAGAKFFIPSLDEWTKAAHFDPNRVPDATGQSPQWWLYPNGTDTPMTYGVPGVGMANAGFNTPSPFGIPLGAYTNVYSPWGLFDMAGATSEWTDSLRTTDDTRYRIARGSWWSSSSLSGDRSLMDLIALSSSGFTTQIGLENGLRIAAAVPSPGAVFCVAGAGALIALRRRRVCRCEASLVEA